MFKFIVTIAVLVGFATICVSESLAQGWPHSTIPDPRFSVEFGAKAYDRPGDDLGLPIITDGITNEIFLDSNDASDLGTAGGAEVKFNWLNKHGRELELRTIIADWEETTAFGGDNLVSPFFIVPGTEPTSINYNYDSDFFSIELMGRRAIRPGVTVMFGPRIVSTKDRVEVTGSRFVGPTEFTEIQTIEATNILLGLQGGLEFNFPIADGIRLNGFGRFGGYTNPTEANFSTIDPLGNEIESTLTKSTGSFLAEVGGRLYVDIIPNCLSTYVGYEATWIDGLALAPAQFVGNGLNGVETANTPFFNAATLGVQWSY